MDIDSAARWHESKQAGLGEEFFNEVGTAFLRIAGDRKSPVELHRSIRRVLLRRFPFGVYYDLSGETAVIIAVMHSSRCPNAWQTRT